MNQDKIDLRIGELLVEAHFLSERDLNEAMTSSKSTGLPVGRVLVMAGFLSESQFQAAVQAQSLIRDSILPFDLAIKALKLVAEQDVDFDQALSESGWKKSVDSESNKLGELLLAGEVVPKGSLDNALKTMHATGLPLGRLLVSLGMLSNELLATALNAQWLVRSGKISREQAISGLNAAFVRRQPIEAALAAQGYYRVPHRHVIRLGDLMVEAGILKEADIMDAVEKSFVDAKSLGQVLLESKKVEALVLDAALSLQEMVSNDTLTIEHSIDCLAKVHETGSTLTEVLAFVEVPEEEFQTRIRFHEFMRVAGLIGQPEIDQLEIEKFAPPSSEDAFESAAQLLNKQLIDERTFYGGLRCYFLIASGWMNMQQGIIALNNFHHRHGSLDEVLHELGWTIRTHIRDLQPSSTAS